VRTELCTVYCDNRALRVVNISTSRALRTKRSRRRRRHQLRHHHYYYYYYYHHHHHHNYHTEGLGQACVCGGVSFYSEQYGLSRPVIIPPLLRTYDIKGRYVSPKYQ